MKRKRELGTKTEVKSIIEELSLLIKLIRRTRRNNDDNNHDNNKKAQPPAAATVAAAAATTAAAAAAVGAEISDDQQKLVVSNIPTRPFLSICSFLIQVLDKIGPTMAVLRQDIYKNIQRLEMLCDSDPTKYSNLVEILKKEAVERNAKKGESCSKALVWLTRSLDFTAALLQKLADEPKESMELIVGNSYETTLKPWHGWISATAYKVALKLVPETGTFISLLMDKGENIDTFKEEIQTLNSLLEPLLEDLHSILSSYGLEKLKST
ncbi:hypothetical protein BVRB_1g010890 [Beta vulgaris subsp. vulgaris]|nr:hypothetical protein BVRB_1g010890 [Beta vulgaris subsp. vulgaris]